MSIVWWPTAGTLVHSGLDAVLSTRAYSSTTVSRSLTQLTKAEKLFT